MLGQQHPEQPFDQLIQLPEEMLENPEFYLAYIKSLIICCSSFQFKCSLRQSFFTDHIKDELESCYIDEELVIDEKYLALRYLEANISNPAGPYDTQLPSLTSPSVETVPLSQVKKSLSGHLKPRQCIEFENLVTNENKISELYDNYSEFIKLFDIYIQASKNIDHNVKEGIIKYVMKAQKPSTVHSVQTRQLRNENTIDMLYNYGHKVNKFCIGFQSFKDLLNYGLGLNGNEYVVSSLIFMCGEDGSLARNLLEHVAPTKFWNLSGKLSFFYQKKYK